MMRWKGEDQDSMWLPNKNNVIVFLMALGRDADADNVPTFSIISVSFLLCSMFGSVVAILWHSSNMSPASCNWGRRYYCC